MTKWLSSRTSSSIRCANTIYCLLSEVPCRYLPTGKVIGLSKIARIVDMYARRLQIQETLTKQIADVVMDITEAAGVGVIVKPNTCA